MRWARHAVGLALVLGASSCAMILDFEDGNTPADGGHGATDEGGGARGGAGVGGVGGGGADGGGGAGGENGSWVTALSPEVGGRVRVQAVEERDGLTWVSGYFTGGILSAQSGDASPEVVFDVHTSEPSADSVTATTFVVAMNAVGAVTTKILLTSSFSGEEDTGQWLGTRFAFDESGNLYVLTSSRDGTTKWPGPTVSLDSLSFSLVLARLADGALDQAPEWALLCAPQVGQMSLETSGLSVRFADIVALGGSRLALGTTVGAAASIDCGAIVGGAAAPQCSVPVRPDVQHYGAVLTFDGEAGTCGDVVEIAGAGETSVWIDDLTPAASDSIVVAGTYSFGSVLDPWDASLPSQDARAFLGALDLPGGEPVAGSLETFPSEYRPASLGNDETFAVSVLNPVVDEEQALDIQLVVEGSAVQLGDAADKLRDEIVATVAVSGTRVLLGGELSLNSSLLDDLCGDGCAGDLVEDGPACEPSPGQFETATDAFWVLLDTSSGEPPYPALGRSFGSCGRQAVVASTLAEDGFTLVAQLTGTAEIDVLDGTLRSVQAPTGGEAVVVFHAHQPAPAE